MKKFAFAFILTLFASSVFANGYCNGKPTQAERDNCNRVNSATGNANPLNGMSLGLAKEVFEYNFQLILRSNKLTDAKKEDFKQQFADFRKNGGSKCGAEMTCRTKAYMAFNEKTKAQYQRAIKGKK